MPGGGFDTLPATRLGGWDGGGGGGGVVGMLLVPTAKQPP